MQAAGLSGQSSYLWLALKIHELNFPHANVNN